MSPDGAAGHTPVVWKSEVDPGWQRDPRARMKVFALIDTRQVSGPCRGLFQLAKLAHTVDVNYVLGLFVKRPYRTYPSIHEACRRGYTVEVLTERFRYDPAVVGHAERVARAQRVSIVQSHGYKSAFVTWYLDRRLWVPLVAF